MEKYSACAKCGKTEAEIVNVPELSQQEEARLDADLNKQIKLLPERKRRTILRKLQQAEIGGGTQSYK